MVKIAEPVSRLCLFLQGELIFQLIDNDAEMCYNYIDYDNMQK